LRDISVGLLDPVSGLSTFALANVKPVTGINLLAAKISKKIFSSTFATKLFTYYGLDLQQVPYTGLSDKSVDLVRTLLSSGLQNIESSIKDNTSSNALPTERLSSLSLEDIVYDSKNHKVFASIKIYPVQGDPQSLLFPLDA
jgi:hypothetical protein